MRQIGRLDVRRFTAPGNGSQFAPRQRYNSTVLFTFRVPADNSRGPAHMEQALAALHHAVPAGQSLSFVIAERSGEVGLFLRLPDALETAVCAQLFGQYPDARIERVAEPELAADVKLRRRILRLVPDVFPLKRHGQFALRSGQPDADPIAPLLHAVAGSQARGRPSSIEFQIRPASAKRCRRTECVLQRLAAPWRYSRLRSRFACWACSTSVARRALAAAAIGILENGWAPPCRRQASSPGHAREDDVQAASDKLGRPLFEVRIHVVAASAHSGSATVQCRLQELAAAFGHFDSPRLAAFIPGATYSGLPPRRWRTKGSSLLSAEELATLFHPPSSAVRPPALAVVTSRELPPPADVPRADQEGIAVLGETAFRERRQRFGIRSDDRLRHIAIVGKTGMGKSTLLHRLIATDAAAGRGVGLIDPHGDLAEAVLAAVPSARTNDVVLFDAADADHPVAFNPLACPDPSRRPLVASGVLAAFKKLFGNSWGPRLEHILRNVLLTVLEVPSGTLITALRILGDPRFRQSVLVHVSDAVVRSFWLHEFAALPPKLQIEAVAPVQNKLGHFVAAPLLRNIVGQERSRIDFRRIMDEGRILIVNLSKGRLGDDASALLGSLLVSAMQIEAMGRAEIPEDQRRPFHLYVDEFQNFATESFATILSEARKYRLALTLANQYLAQMDDATRAAVFGNVGTLVAFQVGADDAETIALQLGTSVAAQDLLQLPRHTACVRLLNCGMPSPAFTMRTLPPLAPARCRADAIRRLSRRRYARLRPIVEREIERLYAGLAMIAELVVHHFVTLQPSLS